LLAGADFSFFLGERSPQQRAVNRDSSTDSVWPTVQLRARRRSHEAPDRVPPECAAVRRNRWQEQSGTVRADRGRLSPTFAIGTAFLYLLAYRFGWFPIGGYGDGFFRPPHHLVLRRRRSRTVGVAYFARRARRDW